MKAQQWMLTKNFVGEPKESDLELQDIEISDELEENEILLEVQYLSVDPYMRPYTGKMPAPYVMIGENLSKVIKSRNGAFPVGSLYLSHTGWRTHFKSKGDNLQPISFDLGSTSPSYCLGTLGMPGATAYFGLYQMCQPKAGETVIVNGAAGAVGNCVGQLAKIRGCKVIAFVGTDDKVAWCKDELKFDHVFNYKKCNFSEEISKVCPEGADVFFDNVGAEWYTTIINKHMKKYGRVTVCGSIENYNDVEVKKYPATNMSILFNELKVEGIIVTRYLKDWPMALTEINKYMIDGKLHLKQTVYEGFGEMRKAFYGLFTGDNVGKAIIKIGN